MEIVRLPPGERADEDTDCIKIERNAGGQFSLITSALAQCEGDNGAESEAVISSELYESYEQAEAAGLAWASDLCVEKVYIESIQ